MPSLLAPLRRPVFARFYVGQTVSQLGDSVFLVALSWEVLREQGSAAALGLVMGALFLGQLAFLLVGGVIVDRFDRRRLVVLSDVLQGGLVAALALLAWRHALGAPMLLAFGFLFGAAQAFAMPALRALLPETVEEGDIAAANGLFQGTRLGAMVVGPALGGALVGLAGAAGAFAFDAATFALSAALLATTRVLRPSPPAPRGGILAEARDGLRYVRRVPWLFWGILLFAGLNLAETGTRNVVLPQHVGGTLGGGAAGIGYAASAIMAGSAIAYVLVGRFAPAPRHRGLVGYGAVLLSGLLMASWALAPGLPALLALCFAYGLAFIVFGPLWETSIMQQVEPRMQGRVASLDMLGSFLMLPLSTTLLGVLADRWGARPTFAAAGLTIAALATLALASRSVRSFEKNAEEE